MRGPRILFIVLLASILGFMIYGAIVWGLGVGEQP